MADQRLPEKAFPVSWEQLHRDCRALAWRLNDAGPFDAIVCITRGGLVPTAIVARELDLRVIDTICLVSYGEFKQLDTMSVLKDVDKSLLESTEESKILIVDDLVDTGKTAELVRAKFPGAHFATVYAKPKGRPLVDTYITEVSQDTWIYFPWDLGYSFQPPIRGHM